MPRHNILTTVFLSLLAVPAGCASDAFTERCIELKAQLPKLDCKRVFEAAQALLVDGKPYLSNVAQELRSNRRRLEALSATLEQASPVARDCVAKHVRNAPAVTRAYISIDQLQVKLHGWVNHRWEFPPDFARSYQHDLTEKYNNALEALRAVGKQL
jgi:hypothetical protein